MTQASHSTSSSLQKAISLPVGDQAEHSPAKPSARTFLPSRLAIEILAAPWAENTT
jgi:hypothetical protein